MKYILTIIFSLTIFAANAAQYFMMMPYSPGNQSDLAARAIVSAYEKVSNDRIIIENHPGADGLLGIGIYKNNKKYDIIWVTSSTIVYNPIIKSDTSYSDTDFNYAIYVGTAPVLWFSNPKLQLKLDPKFDKSNKINFVGVNSSIGQLNTIVANITEGKKMELVAYKGSAEIVAAVASGIIDAGATAATQSILEFTKAGKVDIIGSTYKDTITVDGVRIPSIPKVAGMHQFSGFVALALRPGMEEAKEKQLRQDLWNAMQNPETKETLKKLFIIDDATNSSAQFNDRIKRLRDSAKQYQQ